MIHVHAVTTAIDGERLHCVDRYTGREFVVDGVQTVLLSMGNVAVDDLSAQLDGHGVSVLPIGDCVAPRRLDDALLDGERAAWMV